MDRYDASAIEAEVATGLGGREGASTSRTTAVRAQELRPRDAPVPVGRRSTWGTCSSTRSATSSRASARETACTCCTRRGSTRSGCRPRTRRSARASTRARAPSGTSSTSRARCAGSAGRYDWDRAALDARPEYYRWQQWQFLQFFERGLAYRKGAPVKWCPNDQTVLANEQVLADGHVRALRRRGRVARHGAVVLPDHRLRAGAARRPRDRGLAGVDQGAPAELDRPLRGLPRSSSGSRSSTRTFPSSRPAPTRSTARRSSSSRPSTSSSRASTRDGGPRLRPPRVGEEDRRSAPRRRRRRASSPGSTPSTR